MGACLGVWQTGAVGEALERQHVNSKSLESIGYDAATAVLEVEFLNGHLYQYENVPAGVARELSEAQSKGSYFNARIKGRYRHRRIS